MSRPIYLARWTGLACMLQTADAPEAPSLRTPPRAAQAALSTPLMRHALTGMN